MLNTFANFEFLCYTSDMKKFLFVLFSVFFSVSVFAEIIISEKFNYSIDFPEGYEILDMESDETTVIFKNRYLDAHALIKVWENAKFASANEALKDTLSRIKATTDFSECMWRRQKCAIATLESALLLDGQTPASGWAACIPLPQKKGYLTILSYAPKQVAQDVGQVLISVLDSVLIDTGSFREPGLITTAFYPRNAPKKIQLSINNTQIRTQIDSIDIEASQFVIDREFAIFAFYASHNLPEMFDAWVRFYRLIARDSMERVKKPSFDIYTSLKEACEKKDSDNPDAALAQMLLTWAQSFNYERKSSTPDKADIESIPAILEGGASDCDGRSLLLMCILKNCSVDSCMFVSAEYSHAILGVYFPDKMGQTIRVDDENGGKDYLVGETIDKDVTLGLLRANMADKSKWIPVELP